jgi:hypothetical protein
MLSTIILAVRQWCGAIRRRHIVRRRLEQVRRDEL